MRLSKIITCAQASVINLQMRSLVPSHMRCCEAISVPVCWRPEWGGELILNILCGWLAVNKTAICVYIWQIVSEPFWTRMRRSWIIYWTASHACCCVHILSFDVILWQYNKRLMSSVCMCNVRHHRVHWLLVYDVVGMGQLVSWQLMYRCIEYRIGNI